MILRVMFWLLNWIINLLQRIRKGLGFLLLLIFTLSACVILLYPSFNPAAFANHFHISINHEIKLATYGEDVFIIFLLPAAFLVDKYPLKTMSSFAMFLWGMSLLGFVYTRDASIAIVSWSLVAFACALAFTLLFKYLRYHTAIPFCICLLSMVLAMCAYARVRADIWFYQLYQQVSWAFLLVCFALCMMMLGGIAFFVISEGQCVSLGEHVRQARKNYHQQVASLLLTWRVFLVLQAALLLVPLFSLQHDFLFNFLQAQYNLNAKQALFFLRYMPIGWAIGLLLLMGIASKRLFPWYGGLFLCVVAFVCCTYFVSFPANNVFTQAVLLFIFGLSLAVIVLLIGELIYFTQPNIIATELALVGFLGGLFSWIISEAIYRYLRAYHISDQHFVAAQYPASAYHTALLGISFSLLLVIVLYALTRKSYWTGCA